MSAGLEDLLTKPCPCQQDCLPVLAECCDTYRFTCETQLHEDIRTCHNGHGCTVKRTCWLCHGTKKLWFLDGNGDADRDVCDQCNGTGYLIQEPS